MPVDVAAVPADTCGAFDDGGYADGADGATDVTDACVANGDSSADGVGLLNGQSAAQ